MTRGVLIGAVAFVASAGAAADAANAQPRIIARPSGVVKTLGAFHPSHNPHYGAAVRAYGEADSERTLGSADACRVRWAYLGLTIVFANFGGYNACDRSQGLAQSAVIKGAKAKQWSTPKNLRIGATVRRVRRLYPHATRHGRSWWIVRGKTPIGCSNPSGCPYAIVSVTIRRGHVVAFRVWIGAAGD
jgi:hypothetical protein